MYPSPYTEEAKRQGYDLPWWEKVLTASWEDGLKLGTLRVRTSCLVFQRLDTHSGYYTQDFFTCIPTRALWLFAGREDR